MRPVRILSLMWGVALLAGGGPPLVQAEENRPPILESESPPAGSVVVRDALNQELFDLARALRSIDQSYAFRGIQGCGAWTAGSAHIDWHAQGLCPPPVGTRVLPPPPLVLGGCRSVCRSVPDASCGIHSESAEVDMLSVSEGDSVTLSRRICTGCGHVYPKSELPRCRCHGGEVIGPLQEIPTPHTAPREPTPIDSAPAAPQLR